MEAIALKQHEDESDQLARMQHMCTVLTDRLLSAVEHERRLLAGVLHDDAMQLGYQVERLLRDTLALTSLPADAYKTVTNATNLTNELMSQLRCVVSDLYPPPLVNIGLQPALLALLERVEEYTTLHYSLLSNTRMKIRYLGYEQEEILYYVAREAINNVVKHAHATSLNVTLSCGKTHVYLKIQDDGDGFTLPTVDDLLTEGHLGIALLQERVKQLRGILRIETAPGRGTKLIVRVPLPAVPLAVSSRGASWLPATPQRKGKSMTAMYKTRRSIEKSLID